METLIFWLAGTWLGSLMDHYRWLWPIAETLHFAGLAVLIGVVGTVDLRLLGVMKRVPLKPLMNLMPWAVAAFAVNLVTGLMFMAGEPTLYAGSFHFNMKVLFILLAGGNALYFQFFLWPGARSLGPGEEAATSAKVVATTSLGCWFAVLWFGRLLMF